MHPVSAPYSREKCILVDGETLIPQQLRRLAQRMLLVSGVNGDRFKDGNGERDWRKICEQIAREQEPERFEQLLMELLKALDERPARDIAGRKS